MKPIEVFYHAFIPMDIRASGWTWWLDQQLGEIKNSKLADVAGVNLTITMPKFWSSMNGIPLRVDKHKDQEISFGEKVTEYISKRYPFVNLLEVRDISANLYEGLTLNYIYNRCLFDDIYVCYIHSKGVVSASAPVSNWREVLNHYIIKEWPTCVKQLESADVVGIKDINSGDNMLSGNFWWSKSSHIKTLPPPLDTSAYVSDPDFHPNAPSYRYGFEYWILQNKPKTHFLVDTQTNHFDDYCFLEDLLKKNS